MAPFCRSLLCALACLGHRCRLSAGGSGCRRAGAIPGRGSARPTNPGPPFSAASNDRPAFQSGRGAASSAPGVVGNGRAGIGWAGTGGAGLCRPRAINSGGGGASGQFGGEAGGGAGGSGGGPGSGGEAGRRWAESWGGTTAAAACGTWAGSGTGGAACGRLGLPACPSNYSPPFQSGRGPVNCAGSAAAPPPSPLCCQAQVWAPLLPEARLCCGIPRSRSCAAAAAAGVLGSVGGRFAVASRPGALREGQEGGRERAGAAPGSGA